MRERRGLLGLVLGLAACNASSSGTGGETHWLSDCSSDAQCPGLACLCGVCSLPCTATPECSAESSHAVCVPLGTPLTAACRAGGDVRGLCLGACSDERPCDDGTSCRDGACVPDRALSVAPPSASDYLGVDAGVEVPPFVDLPEPGTVIQSFDPAWAGTWTTRDGSACDSGLGCLRLALGPDGRGTVTWLPPAGAAPAVAGPFPPPTDPAAGYPPGIGATDYQDLSSRPVPGVPYRVLDGRIDGDRLGFWASPVDLWSDWCALQTSFPPDSQGEPRRCVPGGATELDTDPGRLQLCSLACLTPGNCSAPYCTCGPDRCRASLEGAAIPVTLSRVEDGRLLGSLSWSLSASATPLELVPGGP
jgi:hypothetical protein